MSWLAIISKLQEAVLEVSLCWTLLLGDLWFGFGWVFLLLFFSRIVLLFYRKNEMWGGGGPSLPPEALEQAYCRKGCRDHIIELGHCHEKTGSYRGGEKTFLETRGECTEFAFVFSLWVEQNEAWKWKACELTMGRGDWCMKPCYSFWHLCLLSCFYYNKKLKGLFLELKTQKFQSSLVY